MNLSLIHDDQWGEVERRWPYAAAYLLHCSLQNEFHMLLRRYGAGSLNDWERRRLDELTDWANRQLNADLNEEAAFRDLRRCTPTEN